jgi:hypothetical protein
MSKTADDTRTTEATNEVLVEDELDQVVAGWAAIAFLGLGGPSASQYARWVTNPPPRL